MTRDIKVAVLVPTLNAGSQWAQLLKSVKNQTVSTAKKVIIDSGSTDNTVALARQFGFDVVEINKNDFNHGKTRQQLVDLLPDVDICVFLTQDAILVSADAIENIVKAFDNPQIGLAFGRQLPHKGAKTLESHARLYNYPEQSYTRSYEDKDRLGFKVFFCSNSFAAYRRSCLLSIGGFPSNSIMGEDAISAAKLLIKGYKIAYVADAAVYHSHSYTLIEEFKRYFDTRVFHEQNKWLIENYGKPTGEGVKFMKSELRYVVKNDLKVIFKSIASLGAKWIGYKSGKFYKKMSVSMLRKVSMHKHYWK